MKNLREELEELAQKPRSKYPSRHEVMEEAAKLALRAALEKAEQVVDGYNKRGWDDPAVAAGVVRDKIQSLLNSLEEEE